MTEEKFKPTRKTIVRQHEREYYPGFETEVMEHERILQPPERPVIKIKQPIMKDSKEVDISKLIVYDDLEKVKKNIKIIEEGFLELGRRDKIEIIDKINLAGLMSYEKASLELDENRRKMLLEIGTFYTKLYSKLLDMMSGGNKIWGC